MIMIIIVLVLCSIITWYFDAVLPGDFGTPQPFYFPFMVFVLILFLVPFLALFSDA